MQKSKIIGACGLTLLGLMTLNSKTVHADAITWNNGNANDDALETNIKASDSIKANNSVTMRKDIKTSHVNANAPIQKTKVAQFNNGSEIYSLDNGNTLSKSNGSGYVITNAGTYNGRQVDIGVTVNDIKDNQGTYTTKWSNGEAADVTGKTDASFKYQNSVLAGTQQNNVAVPDKTRNRPQKMTTTQQLHGFYMGVETMEGAKSWVNYLDPGTLARALAMQNIKATDTNAVREVAGRLLNAQSTYVTNGFSLAAQNGGHYAYNPNNATFEIFTSTMDDTGHIGVDVAKQAGDRVPVLITDSQINDDGTFHLSDPVRYTWDQLVGRNSKLEPYKNDFNKDNLYTYQITSNESVTDHLQLANKTDASLDYDYKVGVYDAQTGELIDDLMPVYKNKVGAKATSSDSGMNRAIKDKILQINNHQAHSAFTGSQANDDVAFYLETQAVKDSKQLTANASRIITFNLPSSVNKTNYARLVGGSVNGNQVDITDNLRFTRTGTINLATNKATYSNWNAVGNNDSFPSHTIVRIPGYTLTINK